MWWFGSILSDSSRLCLLFLCGCGVGFFGCYYGGFVLGGCGLNLVVMSKAAGGGWLFCGSGGLW